MLMVDRVDLLLGADDSVLAGLARELAVRIDAGEDSAAGLAACVRELRMVLKDLGVGVQVEADPLDELLERRRKRG